MFNQTTATVVHVKGTHDTSKVYVQGNEARLAADMTLITDPNLKAAALTAARRAEVRQRQAALLLNVGRSDLARQTDDD